MIFSLVACTSARPPETIARYKNGRVLCIGRTMAVGKNGWSGGDHANVADHAGLKVYSWKEVGEHKDRNDRWIVIDGIIYDVTSWARRHPGGEKIIGGYAGHDASVSVLLCRVVLMQDSKICFSVLGLRVVVGIVTMATESSKNGAIMNFSGCVGHVFIRGRMLTAACCLAVW